MTTSFLIHYTLARSHAAYFCRKGSQAIACPGNLFSKFFTVFAYEFNNDWIKLVLDKLKDGSGGDNSLCEKIILRPDCNLLEMCQYDTETEALFRSYLSQNGNG